MSKLEITNEMTKWAVLRAVKDELILANGLVMDDVDEHKPWGAYYRFILSEKEKFLKLFFSDLDMEVPGNVNTKIMVFEAGKKISLQYHERRDEIWKVLYGEIDAYIGEADEIGEYKTYKAGETFMYEAGKRHKSGASINGWAVIGEIWKHTDHENLSTEDDNVRLSDDFGRA